MLSFFLATLLVELPFAGVYALVYSNIAYFLVNLNYGFNNYLYFMEVMLLTAVIAFQTAVFYASFFRREFVVRDLYLTSVFVMLLFSGFPFQFSGLANNFQKIAQINPMRWSFEALMVWKFKNYADGDGFLKPYDFQQFNTDHIYPILLNFIVFGSCCFFLSILPPLTYLKRGTGLEAGAHDSKNRDQSRESADYDTPPVPRITTTSIQPIIFSRESSMAAKKSNLSISVSETGDLHNAKGPTVTIGGLHYRIKEIASPTGVREILHNISGQFDWGKLSMILGGTGSGKSSLLHVLAGDIGYVGNLRGDVLFNGEVQSTDLLPWQRCAFVEAIDNHFRDLSVLEVVTYAMKLRCINRKGLAVVSENIERTLEILALVE